MQRQREGMGLQLNEAVVRPEDGKMYKKNSQTCKNAQENTFQLEIDLQLQEDCDNQIDA